MITDFWRHNLDGSRVVELGNGATVWDADGNYHSYYICLLYSFIYQLHFLKITFAERWIVQLIQFFQLWYSISFKCKNLVSHAQKCDIFLVWSLEIMYFNGFYYLRWVPSAKEWEVRTVLLMISHSNSNTCSGFECHGGFISFDSFFYGAFTVRTCKLLQRASEHHRFPSQREQ